MLEKLLRTKFHLRFTINPIVRLKSLGNEPLLNAAKRENPLVVSLTSYKERFSELDITLYSLFCQTVRPDKIILWLSDELELNDLPYKIKQFIKNGLEIRFVKDIRSYTKIIYALKEFSDAVIVTADDDIYYPKDWLEKLYYSYLVNPDDIQVHRAHRVVLGVNKGVSSLICIPLTPDLKKNTGILDNSIQNCQKELIKPLLAIKNYVWIATSLRPRNDGEFGALSKDSSFTPHYDDKLGVLRPVIASVSEAIQNFKFIKDSSTAMGEGKNTTDQNHLPPTAKDKGRETFGRIHLPPPRGEGRECFLPYESWEKHVKEESARFDNFLTGVGGALYPPKCFSPEVFREDVFLKNAPYADDIWLWVMALISNRKIRVVKNHIRTLTCVNIFRQIFKTSKTLYAHNSAGGNDEQLNNLMKLYGRNILPKLQR